MRATFLNFLIVIAAKDRKLQIDTEIHTTTIHFLQGVPKVRNTYNYNVSQMNKIFNSKLQTF